MVAMMTKKSVIEGKERLLALLGLGASQEGVADPCPSDEQLAAFVTGELRKKDRRAVLAHVNRCAECYQQWLEVGAYLDESDTNAHHARTAARAPGEHRLPTWLTSWMWGIPVAAMAVLIALIWWPVPDLNRQVTDSYAVVTSDAPRGFVAIAAELPIPWEGAALGFSASRPRPEALAFGAGLLRGRDDLVRGEVFEIPAAMRPYAAGEPAESGWADYYAFGRWSVLAWALTQSPGAHEWERQLDLLMLLIGAFQERGAEDPTAQEAVRVLLQLEPLCRDVEAQSSAQTRSALRRALLLTMQRFAPNQL